MVMFILLKAFTLSLKTEMTIPEMANKKLTTYIGLVSEYCFMSLLYNHDNIATEGSPKPGLYSTFISNDGKGLQ